jgi:hypothetical protein
MARPNNQIEEVQLIHYHGIDIKNREIYLHSSFDVED